MSVLIGIVCPESVVVAADSHITDECSGTFESVDKISILAAKYDEILVAQAGNWCLTNRVVREMRDRLHGKIIKTENDVTDIAEDSIRATKAPLDEEQRGAADGIPSQIMLAFYIQRKPYLFTVDLKGNGIVSPPRIPFAVTGIGDYLGTYILNEYPICSKRTEVAIATAIFAIAQVKKTTKYCGGDITIKRVAPLGQFTQEVQYLCKSETIGQEFINTSERRLLDLDEISKPERTISMVEVLRDTGMELWDKHVQKIEENKSNLPVDNPK